MKADRIRRETALRVAMKEARRFIAAGETALENPPEYDFVGNRYTAAVKRASLDLTRALADFRRPR